MTGLFSVEVKTVNCSPAGRKIDRQLCQENIYKKYCTDFFFPPEYNQKWTWGKAGCDGRLVVKSGFSAELRLGSDHFDTGPEASLRSVAGRSQPVTVWGFECHKNVQVHFQENKHLKITITTKTSPSPSFLIWCSSDKDVLWREHTNHSI